MIKQELFDKLVEASLAGKGTLSKERFIKVMTNFSSDRKIAPFYSVLDKRHDELSDTDKVNSSEFKNDTDYLLTMFKSLAIGAIKKDANNFGFYDKRTIFIFRITNIIRKVLV